MVIFAFVLLVIGLLGSASLGAYLDLYNKPVTPPVFWVIGWLGGGCTATGFTILWGACAL